MKKHMNMKNAILVAGAAVVAIAAAVIIGRR